ncbi:MAG: alcohol dehydrogenase catalytic domain-containing protein [Bacteroidia bacterium]
MKAIAMTSTQKEAKLQEISLDLPYITDNQVLVKVESFGINPLDVKRRKGRYPSKLPFVLGAEFCGVIVRAGRAVNRFSVGDSVIGITYGNCSNGAYAEYVSVSEDLVGKKAPSLSSEECGAIPIAYLTAKKILGKSKGAHKIFLAGASGNVGRALLSLIHPDDFKKYLLVVKKTESKSQLLQEFPLDPIQVIATESVSQEKFKEETFLFSQGNPFDCIIDLVGQNLFQTAISLCMIGGTVISVVPEVENIRDEIFFKDLIVHHIFVGAESFSYRSQDRIKIGLALDEISFQIEKGHVKLSNPKVIKYQDTNDIDLVHKMIESSSSYPKTVFKF